MIYKVLSLLGINNPTGRVSFNIDCPYCGGRKKLNINVGKGVFNCPKCNSGGGAVALYALFKYGIEPKELKQDEATRRKMFREINNGNGACSEVSYTKAPEMLKSEQIDVDPSDIVMRDKIYNEFLSKLSLNSTHYNDLIRRGLRDEDIVSGGYKSVPAPTEAKNIIKEMLSTHSLQEFIGVPGFYLNDNGEVTLSKLNDGYFIPCKNTAGQIEGMQIRFSNPSSGPKYKWLSSVSMKKGAGAYAWSHFVGYPANIVYLTEGILKANIINRFLDMPVIGMPGVNALKHLDDILIYLKSVGVETIVPAFDMDMFTNIHVLNAYKRLVDHLVSMGFKVAPTKWDEKYKGLDDYLLHIFQTTKYSS